MRPAPLAATITIAIAVIGAITWSPALADPGDGLGTLPSPSTLPEGIAFDGSDLYVTAWNTATIHRLDPRTGAVLEIWACPTATPRDIQWDGSSFWYVSSPPSGATTVYELDADMSVLSSFSLPTVAVGFGCAPVGSELWISGWLASQLHRVDPETGEIAATLPAPGLNPAGLAYDGSMLWVTSMEDDVIHRVDPADGSSNLVVPSPDGNPTGLAWAGGNLWCTNSSPAAIHLVAGAPAVAAVERVEAAVGARPPRLGGASPNPFNPSTRVRFDLPSAGRVRLTVHDVQGRLVRTLVDDRLAVGGHAAVWDGRSDGGVPLGSGAYYLRLEAADRLDTGRLVLLR